MNGKKNKVSILTKAGYGIGNLGFGIVFQCIAAYLLFYATAVLGIKGLYIGTIMAVGIFWDAISDPIMGYISDTKSIAGWGRRHFYLLVGTFSISIFNLFLWHISPAFSQTTKLIFIFSFLMLLKTSLTIYGTPYTALGAELSFDYNERTSIQGFKTVAFLLGLGFPMVAGLLIFFKDSAEYPIGQLNPTGYSLMGTATSVFMIITGIICILSTYKYRFVKVNNKKEGVNIHKVSFFDALKNKYFIYVFMGYIFVNISSALIGSIGLHVFTYTFKLSSNDIALVMGSFFGGSIISLPYWVSLSKKQDKKPVMLKCIKISALASSMFLISVLLKAIVIKFSFILIPIVFILGFGSGGLFMIPPSMTADTIDFEEQEKGYRSEGIYYGALTFGYKMIQSLVLLTIGILLDAIKFDTSLSIQSNFTSTMLGLILTIGSLIAFGLAYISMFKYDLSRDKVEQIQINIMEMRLKNDI